MPLAYGDVGQGSSLLSIVKIFTQYPQLRATVMSEPVLGSLMLAIWFSPSK